MPVVNQLPALSSPPTNVYGLYQYLAQRLPGYDPSEYLRELNSAYVHVWEEISKLKNHWFSNLQTLTVVNPQTSFDLQYNADGALSGVLSNRLYQLMRVRVQSPSGSLWQTTKNLSPQEPRFTELSANPQQNPVQTGPYYWYIYGRNNIQFAMPLQKGTVIEFFYTFWPIQLNLTFAGSIQSTDTIITGAGTTFTQLLQPDFQQYQPAAKAQQEILAELVCNTNQIYAIKNIELDTLAETLTTISPTLTVGSPYVLATLPEIPREHIRVIASIAMCKMYSVDGDDQRTEEWAAIAASNMQMMKDSLMERQGQDPPTKKRFPFGIGRGNRGFLTR